MVCYLWKDKKTNEPYIGIVEGNRIDHQLLIKGNRTRMKILPVNPNEDLPIETIQLILNEMIALYTSGTIKVKK